jgi:demethylmenaquinone methyltransferase/2-methoxy-6-polyprenyl-1,4-benzoquinol methylase
VTGLTRSESAMRGYYDRRAAEYDSWWLGTGLFASRSRPGWDAERQRLVDVVAALSPVRVLDVACGTGFLTRHLRGMVTGLDQSPRMVEIAASRLPGATVVQGEALPLPFQAGAFDRVFTSHFYGHLLPGEREAFAAEALRVAPELVVVDSALWPGGVAEDWQERRLEDGSRHAVYKRWFEAEALASELGGGDVLHAGDWFVAVRVRARRSRRAAARRSPR